MKARLVRLARRAGRALEKVPLRGPGLVLLGAGAYAAFLVGRAESDYLLYPAGLGAIGLVALCALTVGAAALVLRRAVTRHAPIAPDDLETLAPRRTGFRFPRLGAWPLVEVTMRWEEPATVEVTLEPEGRFFEEVIVARERGRHPSVTRRFTVHDLFGLTAVSFRVTSPGPLRVAPTPAVAGAELAASYSHGDSFSHPAGRPDGDLVEMRAYGHGDPLRHILWKTFARTRRLLVRMPERAIAPRPVTVAFLVTGAGDEPTASVARLYLERGFFGPDFVFAADGADRTTAKPHEAVEQIIDSAAARAQGGAALEGLGGSVERAQLGSCVIFAPPIDGAWRGRVSTFARRLPSPATVVIGVDGEPADGRRGLVSRLLWTRPADEVLPDRLPALRAALEAEGLRVQVLHRRTGQVL
jgi:hypothetical protein